MIRQFGLPTFFITLSAAETKWNELLVILSLFVDQRVLSEDEAAQLSNAKKSPLIRSDPVTCSRYFDYRFRQLMKLFKGVIFEEFQLSHYYWRIEFQHRGSPHSHGMYWLTNAPKVEANNPDSIEEVIEFIDRFIATEGISEDPDLTEALRYQHHVKGRLIGKRFVVSIFHTLKCLRRKFCIR